MMKRSIANRIAALALALVLAALCARGLGGRGGAGGAADS